MDFNKYPLVQKAEAFTTSAFFALGAEKPEELSQIQFRACDIIDQDVKLPTAQKETLMVGVFLSMAPPIIFDGSLGDIFTPEVELLANDMLQQNQTAEIAQIGGALAIAMVEQVTEEIKAGRADAQDKQKAAELVRELGKVSALELTQEFQSEGLAKHLFKASFELEQALSGKPNGPKNTPKKPGGGNLDF